MAGNLATGCLHLKAVLAGTFVFIQQFTSVYVSKMDGLPFLPGNTFCNPTVNIGIL